MYSQKVSLLVICLVTVVAGIRVDWNTNQGPIIPPTPRTTVRPVPPFRAPAPVWEDQSNDIPNPNPYVYVPPPPSRPRYNNNNNNNVNNNHINSYNNGYNVNYGSIIAPTNDLGGYYGAQSVSSLAAAYVPGFGIRYYAVVPTPTTPIQTTSTLAAQKGTISASKQHTWPQTSTNGLTGGYSGYGDKLQGKYNAKTKKYKAYEKVKYSAASSNNNNNNQLDSFNMQRVDPGYLLQQELPSLQPALPFKSNPWKSTVEAKQASHKKYWEKSQFKQPNSPNAIHS